MEGFRFETDSLNEYFTKKTGKEHFTLEELKSSNSLDIKLNRERISQNEKLETDNPPMHLCRRIFAKQI